MSRPFTEITLQSILELLAYLRANGFRTYIVSGDGVGFLRPWAQRVYANQFILSAVHATS